MSVVDPVEEYSIYKEYMQRINNRTNLIAKQVQQERVRDIQEEIKTHDYPRQMIEHAFSFKELTSVEASETLFKGSSHQYSKELEPIVYVDKKSANIVDLVNDSKLSGYVHEKWSLPACRQAKVECSCSIGEHEIEQAEADTEVKVSGLPLEVKSDMVCMDDYSPVGADSGEHKKQVSFNFKNKKPPKVVKLNDSFGKEKEKI